MRNTQLLNATVLPLLLASACAITGSDQTTDPILGECGESSCEGDDHGDHGDDHGGGDCHDSSCGGGGGGGGGADVDVDVDVDLDVDANLELEVIGSGIYVGLFPLGCLDISGDFSASAHATASLDGDHFVIANVDANASIDLGNGCSCSGITASAIAAINVSASIDASLDACVHACVGLGSECETSCHQPGNKIVATASLDANACASVSVGGALDLDALVGVAVDLDLTAVVDIDGNIVVNL